MERRKILKSSIAFLSTATFLALGYPVFRFLSPPPKVAKRKPLTIDKDAIPPGAAKEVIIDDAPVIIINRRASGFIALSRVCTHLGCLVGYDKYGEKLVCPCHAGVFDLSGKTLGGPPSRPLKRYPMTITAKRITIG